MLFLTIAQYKPFNIFTYYFSALRPTDSKKVSKESAIMEDTELRIKSF